MALKRNPKNYSASYMKGKWKGKGVVAKVEKLSKQVHSTMPSRKVYQQRIIPYVSNVGNPDQNATVGCAQLQFPSTGVTFSDRQNSYIHCHKLELIGTILTSTTSDIVRVLVFQMTDAFEVGTAVSFNNPGNNLVSAAATPLQPSNLCSQRYRMLYDSGPFNVGTSGGLQPYRAFRKTINMKGRKVDFGSSTSTIPAQNNVYVVVWGTQTPGVGPTYITTTIADLSFQLTYSG